MDPLQTFYSANSGWCNVAIAVLVFGGMARIAFWRDSDGLRVGGMLAVGLAFLLAVSLLAWASETGRSITDLGPWAAGLLLEAIIIMGLNARRKSKDL